MTNAIKAGPSQPDQYPSAKLVLTRALGLKHATH
jgi:hypothetical protein